MRHGTIQSVKSRKVLCEQGAAKPKPVIITSYNQGVAKVKPPPAKQQAMKPKPSPVPPKESK